MVQKIIKYSLTIGEPSLSLTELHQQVDLTPYFPKIKNRISAADAKITLELYKKGCSLGDIAEQFSCSKNKVRSCLLRNGIELRERVTLDKPGRFLKPGKHSARPYYGFCYFEGSIVKDPREFPVLQKIHRLWSRGKTIHQINLEMNRAKTPARTAKNWSWAAIKNIVSRFESENVNLQTGGKYELR